MKKNLLLLCAFLILSISAFMFAARGLQSSFKVYAADGPTEANIGPRTNNYDDPIGAIYVSPGGNDATADGSITAPFKSINTALAAASDGGAIVLRNGTYKEGINVRVETPGITIKSAKGEWAIIDLREHDSGHEDDSGVWFYPGSNGGRLQAVEVIGGYYAVCVDTEWDWPDPILEPGVHGPGVSGVIIEDCKLHDSKDDVVKVKPGCDNITIRYNEIYNSGREHITHPDFVTGERNSEGIDNVNGGNMKAQNNYIHDICSTGVYAKGGARNALIENNRIERAYAAGIMVGFDTSPAFFSTDTNPEYYENIDGVVRNNLIINTGWEGIGLYASKNAEIYNNTIINAVTYGTGNYHTPIYFGIATQDEDPISGMPANINPSIHHNVVCQPASYNRAMIEIRYIEELNLYEYIDDVLVLAKTRELFSLSGMPDMHDNCYYIEGKSATFTDNRPDSKAAAVSLAAWKAHIAGDTGSVDTNPVLDDDYIATAPQCIGMGIQFLLIETTPSPTDDDPETPPGPPDGPGDGDPETPPSQPDEPNGKGLSTAEIVGIVAGSIAVLGISGIIIYLIKKRK